MIQSLRYFICTFSDKLLYPAFAILFSYLTYYFSLTLLVNDAQLNEINNTFIELDESKNVISREINLLPFNYIWNNEYKLQASINYLNYYKYQQRYLTSFWYQSSFVAIKSNRIIQDIVINSPNYYPAIIEMLSHEIYKGGSYNSIKSKIDMLYGRVKHDQSLIIKLVELWLQYVYIYPKEDELVATNVSEILNSKFDYRAVTQLRKISKAYLNEQSHTIKLFDGLNATYL